MSDPLQNVRASSDSGTTMEEIYGLDNGSVGQGPKDSCALSTRCSKNYTVKGMKRAGWWQV